MTERHSYMEYPYIASAHNETVKHLVKLRECRHREREKQTILEGYRELTRALEYGMEILDCFFSPEHFLGSNEYALLEKMTAKKIPVRRLAPQLLEKVSYRDRPEGLLAIARIRNHRLEDLPVDPNGLYLVAETVEKPGNLGSMLRSADAVNATGFILCERGTDIYNPNTIRASTGALFSVPLAECSNEEALAWLRKNDIRTLAATPHAEKRYTDVDLTRGVAIIVGAEQTGLSEFWMTRADLPVVIPMLGKIDSLNVSTATTVLLYEAARQRNFRK